MLTADDLAGMRETTADAMPDTAIVSRRVLAKDGQGGHTTTFAAAGTVACRVRSMRGDETVQGGELSAVGLWEVAMPANTTVKPHDVISVGGTAYEPMAEIADHGAWELEARWACSLTGQGGTVARA